MARRTDEALQALWNRLGFLRIGPLREGAFRSTLYSEKVAALLGISLGVTFGICFVTGLISHSIQRPPSWFLWPSRPVNLYRISQGLHVATGIAAVPLLLAKLWVVYPRLFIWPPVENAAHALERLSLFPLVGGAVFLLMTGLNNIALWYPWDFFFPLGHYWAAWITIGALVVHVGAKSPIVRQVVFRRHPDSLDEPTGGLMTRRRFLYTVATAVVAVTVTTVGQTVRPLRRLAVLAPRDPAVGPQGFPVNKTARSARVTETALDPDWRLSIEGAVDRPRSFSRADLLAMELTEVDLPISCVEGWSATARWRGVPLPDLLARAGAAQGAEVTAESLQPGGLYRRAAINRLHAGDPLTLIALEVNGEPLHLEHGFPARLIGPNRPGVMQTKWLSKLVVS